MKYPTINQYIDAIVAKQSKFKTLQNVKLCLDKTGQPIYKTTNTTVLFDVIINKTPKSIRLFTANGSEQRFEDRAGVEKLAGEIIVVVGEWVGEFDLMIEDRTETEQQNIEIVEDRFEFRENRRIFSEDGKYGFQAPNEQVVIGSRYDSVENFREGRAVVEISGYYGLVDPDGREVIEPIYDEISYDGSHMCYVNHMGQWGVMDRNGNILVENKWDWIGEFVCGVVVVEKDGLSGYVNSSGEVIGEIKYTTATAFDHQGYAKVVFGGESYEIDIQGNKI